MNNHLVSYLRRKVFDFNDTDYITLSSLGEGSSVLLWVGIHKCVEDILRLDSSVDIHFGFLFLFLRQVLTVGPRLASNSELCPPVESQGLPIDLPGPGTQAHATGLAFYVHPAHRTQVFLLMWQGLY